METKHVEVTARRLTRMPPQRAVRVIDSCLARAQDAGRWSRAVYWSRVRWRYARTTGIAQPLDLLTS